jgi:hypothetical protein
MVLTSGRASKDHEDQERNLLQTGNNEAVQTRMQCPMHQDEQCWWDIIQCQNMLNRLDQDLGKLESLVPVVGDGEMEAEVFRTK